MKSERTSDGAADTREESGDAVLFSVFGEDVVVEEEFVEFPWLAGMKRGPAALFVTFLIVLSLAAASGISGGTIPGTIAYLALVVYGLHNIPVVRGQIPGVLEGVADPVLNIPLLRGFVLTGPDHGSPIQHVIDIASGKTAKIGHINPLPADPQIPIVVYAAVPMLVLVAVGAEFALRYWEDVTVDSVLEVGRFGAAIAAGYVLTLFVGTFFVTTVGLFGIVLPDRYMTLIFGFVYPAVFATVGAVLVYVQREIVRDDAATQA